VSFVDLGLTCADGDALAVRAFADALLKPVAFGRDVRDARLLLTALLLCLQGESDPVATVADLLLWLEAICKSHDALAALCDSPMQLLGFIHVEWLSLADEAQRLALGLCVAAARRVSGRTL
jgi:hypothetical protein